MNKKDIFSQILIIVGSTMIIGYAIIKIAIWIYDNFDITTVILVYLGGIIFIIGIILNIIYETERLMKRKKVIKNESRS